MSALTFLLLKLNALQKETLTNRQTLSEPKPRCIDHGVLNLHHDNDVKEVVSSQPVSRDTSQPIGKPELYIAWKLNNNYRYTNLTRQLPILRLDKWTSLWAVLMSDAKIILRQFLLKQLNYSQSFLSKLSVE